LHARRTDDAWHHIALTWAAGSGEARLYWDGQEQTPFWAARQGKVEAALPSAGGVAKQLAAGTTRLDHGAPSLARCALLLLILRHGSLLGTTACSPARSLFQSPR
jgi:hypothetical protein